MKLALFDLDGTLLPIDSDHAFGEFLVSLGWVDPTTYRQRNDAFYEQYKAERLDIAAYVDFCTAPWRDRPAAEFSAAMQRFLDDVVRPVMHPAAIDLVARHRDAGDRLVMVTATHEVITRPIAELFGIEALIATELVRDDRGRCTGSILGVPAFREGKVRRVSDWLASQGLSWHDFDDQVFYSDSTNDLPLLEHVSEPVATNPGPALEAWAQQRRWRILRLFT